MHSFTIALISTLSLGVHAASIGDSVPQLVTREQHNRLFHSPDFNSANLPAVESLERSGKISPRKVAVDATGSLLNGVAVLTNTESNTAQGIPNTQTFIPSLGSAAIGGNIPSTSNTQPVTNAQTFSLGSGTVVDNILSGALALDGITTPKTVDTQAANIQVIINAQITITTQINQFITAAISLSLNADVDIVLSTLLGQAARALEALVLVNEQLAEAAVTNCLSTTLSSNLVSSNGLGLGIFSANAGVKRDDTEKRQEITAPTALTQTAKNAGVLPALALRAREDNTKFFDDQVEDMDFSAHDSEADELEEGF